MGHTYTSSLFHCVFSTAERRPLLTAGMRERLYPYLGGIARQNGFRLMARGGTEDHLHLVISLPATMPLSKAVQLLKGGSSKWIGESFPGIHFAWQEGYGGFSISISQLPTTVAYVNNQQSHHAKVDYRAEFVAFLKRHGIQFDQRYVVE